jgi:hypothetical protein
VCDLRTHSGARYHRVETYEVWGPLSTVKSLQVPKSIIFTFRGLMLTIMLSGFKSRWRIPSSSFKYYMPINIYFIIVFISCCSDNQTYYFLPLYRIYYVKDMSIISKIINNRLCSYSIRSAFITYGQCP